MRLQPAIEWVIVGSTYRSYDPGDGEGRPEGAVQRVILVRVVEVAQQLGRVGPAGVRLHTEHQAVAEA